MKDSGMTINFIKVPAYTSVELNETADKLAKETVGILTKIIKQYL